MSDWRDRLSDEQKEDIQREQDAVARLNEAIETIKADLHWYWHWGDGQGDAVLSKLREAVLDRGLSWPFDADKPLAPSAKAKISRSLAKRVHEKHAYRCVTCGSHVDLCCDHIIPESKGGPTTFENLQTMCRPCNSRKGNRA